MARMPVSESSVAPADAGQAVENDYDSFAEAYSAENEASLVNAYYCRPAILDLAGDVTGRRILDAGCGSGPIAAGLRDQGATVTGFDRSAKMLELARRQLGADADLRVADLSRPLPYPDGAFDDVIVSLVLHYLEDWAAPLAELRRVLRPGGRLILALNHPLVFPVIRPDADYFAILKWSDEYTSANHRPLRTHRPTCSPPSSRSGPRGRSYASCSSSSKPTSASKRALRRRAAGRAGRQRHGPRLLQLTYAATGGLWLR